MHVFIKQNRDGKEKRRSEPKLKEKRKNENESDYHTCA